MPDQPDEMKTVEQFLDELDREAAAVPTFDPEHDELPPLPEQRIDHVEVDNEHTFGMGSRLKCPCGEEYLHHHYVKVYERPEDGAVTKVTTVQPRTLTVRMRTNEASGNPSQRRDGLAVGFTCENCGRAHELLLAQHKGVTFLRWRAVVQGRGWPRD